MNIEISLQPFKHKHLKMLIEMLKDHDYPHISKINMTNLPKIGYIATMSGQPVAAGFLRRVEGNYAQLDTLTSNPYFGSQIRHEGIKLVVDQLFDDAKALEVQSIIAFTADLGILQRSKLLGFQEIDQKVIGIALK